MIPVTCKQLSVNKLSDAVKIGLDKYVVEQKIDDGVLSAVANLWLGLKDDLQRNNFPVVRELTTDVTPIAGRIQDLDWGDTKKVPDAFSGKLCITLGRGRFSNNNKGNNILRALTRVAAYSFDYPALSKNKKPIFTGSILSHIVNNEIPFFIFEDGSYKQISSPEKMREHKVRNKISQLSRHFCLKNNLRFGKISPDPSPAKRNNQSSGNNNSTDAPPNKRHRFDEPSAKRNNQSSMDINSTDVPPNKRHRFD